MSKVVLLKPILSEKAYALSDRLNTYVFSIPAGINRHAVAKAVAQQYEVTVLSVRVAASPGKSGRTYSKSARKFHSHQTSGIRKAYVSLKEGDNLPFFTEIEKTAKETK